MTHQTLELGRGPAQVDRSSQRRCVTLKRSVNRLCAEPRWYADELPELIEGSTPRRWRLSNVEAWMIQAEQMN